MHASAPSIAPAAASPQFMSSALALSARILVTLLFVLSGISKVEDPAGTIAYIVSAGLPYPTFAFVATVAVETIGGTALLLGYRTRSAALALAAFTVAAAVAFHFHVGNADQLTHFLKNLAITGGLLQVAAFGPGRFSLDARW